MSTKNSASTYIDTGFDLCENTPFKVLLPDEISEGNKIEFLVPGYGKVRYNVSKKDIDFGFIIVYNSQLP